MTSWQRFLRDSVPGTVCPPHQIPCDLVQRCLLSIKMAVFMDRVCKINCCPRKGLFLWIESKNRHCGPKTAHSVVQPWCKNQKQNRKSLTFKDLRFLVPGAGIEPARIAPLVCETSAATDSSIRAGVLFVACGQVASVCRRFSV